MANRTDSQADTVHGTNPQYLVSRIVRSKIYNDAYWKEFCFGLTNESFIDEAAKIEYVGGTYGGRRRPTKFLCLFLKLLQIQPDEDVVLEIIKQPDLKYLRALGAAYYRISQRHIKVFQTLEPLFADYRKLRYRDIAGKISLIHMDEFIDWLLREPTVCDVTMPGIPKRDILEATMDLAPRESILDDDLEDLEDLEEQFVGPSSTAAASAPKADDAESDGAGVAGAGGAECEADYGSPEGSPEKSPSPAPVNRSPERKRSPERERCRERKRSDEARSQERNRSRERRTSRETRSKERVRSRSNRRRRDRRAASSSEIERIQRPKKKEKWKLDKKERKREKEKDKERGKETKVKNDKSKDNGKDVPHEKPKQKKDKDGLSVNEWNEIRKSMGLKPLKS